MLAWHLLHDIRFALRSSLKTPGTTFVVVLTLAVAIGANTAIFSVVESVLLQPLPYPDEDRIVRVAPTVRASGAGDRGQPFSEVGYWHFADNQRSFEKFGGYYGPEQLPLTGDGPPRQISVGSLTLSAFEVLGVYPELGRLPTREEDAPGGAPVALLSHDLWVTQYGGDASIIGSTVDLNGTPREVIGVMPARYNFMPFGGFAPDIHLWVPLQLDPASRSFGDVYIHAIGRLAPGVTIEAASDDVRSLVARFDEAGYPPSWSERFDGAVVRPLRDHVVGSTRQPLLIVLGTVACVLLIACSNVANLLLVRAESRRQENAVRMALGSGRARLARQMLTESALLALTGGAAGVLFAHWGTRSLVALAPQIPRLEEASINGATLAFTAAVSVLTGLLFGVLPAFRSSSTDTMGALRDGGRNATLGRDRHRTRSALVTTQVALAVVLVIGSGLMVRSFAALRSVDPGFATEKVLTFTVQPLATKYPNAEAVAQLYDRLVERLMAVPSVTRAAAVNTLPFSIFSCCNVNAVVEEFPPAAGELPPNFRTHRATPGYFEAMSILLIEGRAFTPDDHSSRLGSVIISRSVKDRYWPDTSALGKRIAFSGGRVEVEVVGVVGDVHDWSLELPVDQNIYLPMLDAEGSPAGFMSLSGMTFTVRTGVEPLSLVGAIRSAIAELDPDLPIADVQTMQDVVSDSMARTSFTMSLLVLSALIALFLGAVGIYSVLSYVVSQRTPEIGIRSALGATPAAVRRIFLTQGMRLAGVGVVLGLVAAVALGRVLLAQLYGVSPVDPPTLLAGSAIFLSVAALASLLPAARAAGTSPLDALRSG